LQSGSILNERYQIVDLIAEGGMARVYRAKDIVLDRAVAVKVLREQYAADEVFLARFQQEARAAASLAHPNIVSIYDVGSADRHQYIVMELVEGPNLKLVLQQEGAISPGRAIDIILQVLAALSFAHSRGLVHRDVKPQNILLTGQNHAKVADFGIAIAAADCQLTEPGVVMGSVHYCAPEQAMGKGATQASDVYSAGVML
jgi:serine/threonine-protein kinase